MTNAGGGGVLGCRDRQPTKKATMDRNFAIEGYQAANKHRYLGWLLLGILPPFGLFAPLLLRLASEPVPSARVLEKGPTEATAQQVFIAAYIARAQARRRRKAWLGFALSFSIYAFSAGGYWIGIANLSNAGAGSVPAAAPGGAGQQAVERSAGAEVAEELRGTAAAVEAERRRYAEETRVREAEAREQLPVRIEEIEALYDAIAETHEAIAGVLADEWEQQWARDRATTARSTKRRFVENLEATREFQGVEAAFGIAGAAYRDAELELADAREQLAQAQAASTTAR